MSIIRSAILTLETIISTSDVIVEVEAVEPFEERIPIPSDNPNNALPDFIKRGLIFKVSHTLKNTSKLSIPEKIRVPNEDWRRRFSQHKEQYARGPSKSYTVNTYGSKVPSMKEAGILFLRRSSDDFSLVAHNSYESPDSIKIIEAMIKS